MLFCYIKMGFRQGSAGKNSIIALNRWLSLFSWFRDGVRPVCLIQCLDESTAFRSIFEHINSVQAPSFEKNMEIYDC